MASESGSGTTLGKAFIKIMPSMDGFKKTIEEIMGRESEDAGRSSGKAMGAGIVSSLKSSIAGLIAAAGIGKLISDSFLAGADLEQQIGGIETLFNDSADRVREYANNAYKTAGMSANQYMSLATSFSAKLLQGLGNDTAKAAEYANMAMTDMSDNANKMGTDMESITYAYQGFAKDNYEMLDNLKLGYGGTQSEMARLVNESGVLGDSVKVTAESVKDVPFDKIIEAIHVIQSNLGITGTTAIEAKDTFTGSFNAMKAAAENFLAAFMMNGKDGVDITPALEGLITTTSTFLFGNALPAIGRMITSLITIVPQLITQGIPTLLSGATQYFNSIGTALSTVISSLPGMVQTYLPQILQFGMQLITNLVTGITQAIPQLVTVGSQIINNISSGLATGIPQFLSQALPLILQFTQTLRTNFPQILRAGLDLIVNLVQGLMNGLPQLIAYVPQIISNIAGLINDNMPMILQKGIEIVITIGKGLINAIPSLVANIPQIIMAIVDVFTAFNWLNLGKNIIDFLANGVKSMVGTAGQAATKVFNGIKNVITNLPATLQNLGSQAISFMSSGIRNMISTVVSAAGSVLSGIVSAITSLPSKLLNIAKNAVTSVANAFKGGNWLSIGKNILSGIANGIIAGVGGLVSSAINACKNLLNGVKNFFGIASPSKLMKKEIGRFIPPGIGEGVTANMDAAIKPVAEMNQAIEDAIKPEFDKSLSVKAAASIRSGRQFADGTTAAVKNYGGVTIVVNAKDGKSAREIAKEVKKILVTDEEIERRGKLA